jgi:trigger factor
MQVSVTTTGGLERRLEVAVPGARVASEVDERLKRLTRTARLKGFRPGKVPYAVVKQQFGTQVHAEAVSDLMHSTFAEAVSQQKLRPAGGPRLEPLAIGPEGLRYAATFEVLPEITLKPLDTIQIERPTAAVTEEDVDAMLETMRAQRPIFTLVDRPAQAGDRVTIDYEGRIDGEVFAGGAGELVVSIGAQRVLPEIEQALIGMSAAEAKSVPARFPDNYRATAVAGKPALFEIKVKKVEEQTLPALDASFAQSFGVHSGVPELREEVQRSMERELAEAVRMRLREQLFAALYRDNPFDVPRGMLERQTVELQAETMRRLGIQDPTQLPAREQLEANARQRVALGLLIGEIVRAQGLKVDRARVQERLEAAIAPHPNPEEARRAYLGSREAMGQLETAALEDQAVDWLLSQVKLLDRPSSFRELTGYRGPSETPPQSA